MKLEIVLVEFTAESWMGLTLQEEACLFGMALEEEDLSPSLSYLLSSPEDVAFSKKKTDI
ncbi:hypothetical protein KW850_27410 [Bacillus sp. sid0103]|uniref:hypothetical protein n=1 Tax=Bacillus sp. sid0103 TaxID=2856337 RepID=UPI001C45F30F|nr:hypothetical protein [Bacillus sp. sid0103]MBV7508935.1 hypothetical protein [Bacillus sp. sid0103]